MFDFRYDSCPGRRMFLKTGIDRRGAGDLISAVEADVRRGDRGLRGREGRRAGAPRSRQPQPAARGSAWAGAASSPRSITRAPSPTASRSTRTRSPPPPGAWIWAWVSASSRGRRRATPSRPSSTPPGCKEAAATAALIASGTSGRSPGSWRASHLLPITSSRSLPTTIAAKAKAELLFKANAAARAHDKRITQVGVGFRRHDKKILIANSEGLLVEDTQTLTRFGVSCAALEGERRSVATNPRTDAYGSSISASPWPRNSAARRRRWPSGCSRPRTRPPGNSRSSSPRVTGASSSTRPSATASRPTASGKRPRASGTSWASPSRSPAVILRRRRDLQGRLGIGQRGRRGHARPEHRAHRQGQRAPGSFRTS